MFRGIGDREKSKANDSTPIVRHRTSIQRIESLARQMYPGLGQFRNTRQSSSTDEQQPLTPGADLDLRKGFPVQQIFHEARRSLVDGLRIQSRRLC